MRRTDLNRRGEKKLNEQLPPGQRLHGQGRVRCRSSACKWTGVVKHMSGSRNMPDVTLNRCQSTLFERELERRATTPIRMSRLHGNRSRDAQTGSEECYPEEPPKTTTTTTRQVEGYSKDR